MSRLRSALPSLAESQGDPCDGHPEIEGENFYYSLRLQDADGIEFFHLIEANDKALAWARLLSAHPEYEGAGWSLEANEPYGMLSFFDAEAIKLEYRLQSGNSPSSEELMESKARSEAERIAGAFKASGGEIDDIDICVECHSAAFELVHGYEPNWCDNEAECDELWSYPRHPLYNSMVAAVRGLLGKEPSED